MLAQANGAPQLRYADEFRRCLEECDVEGVRRLWHHVAPYLPQPANDSEALMSLHHARTLVPNLRFKLRAYSHAWLKERGFPSGLPDELRPRAERLYPVIVPAVGISANFHSAEFRPLKPILQKAMGDAVCEVHADGKIYDTPLVTQRMREARAKVFKQLMLPFGKR